MATLRARWLLSILLFSLQHRFAKPNSPAPPSDLDCFIPCDETGHTDIHCTWDPKLDPQIPANYSLHWEAANKNQGHVISETRWNGSIQREHFSSHEDIYVWVEVNNKHGSAKSQKVAFNTADIVKPPPPNIAQSNQEPLEIEWSPVCDQLHSVESCEVQHRTEANQIWVQTETGISHSYSLDNPQPCTIHEFQVRCTCTAGKTSDWSESVRIPAESAPVGELDIWRDCGLSPTGFDCVLTWKKLSPSQACGMILGYEVRLLYKNGTVMLVNVSTDRPSSQLICNEMQCYLPSPLKDVSSANVSAYNAHGATVPAYLEMPVQGKEKDEQSIALWINEENITVSWNLTSQLSDNLNEIVVQYKQAGSPPGQGFHWIKVNEKQTTGFFKGHFNKSTPYSVSLFTVSHNREVHHFSSLIGYFREGTPPKVPSFKVFSIAATQVTLFWEAIPLSKQNGVIRSYQIGVEGQNVHNVNPSPQQQNYTFDLQHLSPGQDYEVWIRAVTAAGPGDNATTRFKTKQHENYVPAVILPGVLAVCCLGLICLTLYCRSSCQRKSKACPLLPQFFYDKVPDPGNSHIFTHMKHQINDPLAWLCKSTCEPHPKIVVLEIVEIQHGALKSPLKKTSKMNGLNMSVVGDGCSQMDCQGEDKEDAVTGDCDRIDHRYEREEYSKMLDSDEERDGEEDRDDCLNLSEEEDFVSGYEKHFMPTALEILEVS